MDRTDATHLVVGGGIVGLATARELARRDPNARVLLCEKESDVARHQTGRNSGVVHSGLYYAPGSLKARTCVRGRELLEAFVATHAVPYERTGKVVVAVTEDELPRLQALEERGRANGLRIETLGPEALREHEPEAAGIRALFVHETGIVDYAGVCRALAEELRGGGHALRFGVRVEDLRTEGDHVVASLADGGTLRVRHAVNCAGLHSDRLGRTRDERPTARIVPFRGEYYELTESARPLVRNLIYPVPDPRFPFLGVHFTRCTSGAVECGPNAVFALAREGYRWRDVDLRDLADALGWPGTWRLFARHWRTGVGETWRSFSKRAFVHALRRLVPAIRPEHLRPAPAGVRAQALGRDGRLLDDFVVRRQGPITHVVNAPSPAATAALAIAECIAESGTP